MPFETWQPGMLITEERMASISPTWTDWTPVWTTSTGANTPSFGNAVIVARYAQAATTVYWRLEIFFGSTTNFGGGGTGDNWRISTPVAAAATASMVGFGEAQDTSATNGRLGIRARLTTTSTFEFEVSTGRVDGAAVTNSGLIDSLSPWTWANTDVLRAFGEYEAAA